MAFLPSLMGSNMSGLGSAGQMGGMGGAGMSSNAMSGMLMQMMQMMMTFMQMMMMNSGQAMMPGGMPNFGGGGGGGTPGLGPFLGDGGGGGSYGGPSSGYPSSAPSTSQAPPMTGPMPSGDGAAAVEIAMRYMGRRTGDINDLPNFTRTGHADNNCAEFVSSCLATAGTYKKMPGDAKVSDFKQHLMQQGWRVVPRNQAKPGDVAIFNGSQHAELVTQAGGGQMIGSNNKGGGSVQYVGTDSGNWGSVEILSRG